MEIKTWQKNRGNSGEKNLLIGFIDKINKREIEIRTRIEEINSILLNIDGLMININNVNQGQLENNEIVNLKDRVKKLQKYAEKLIQEFNYLKFELENIKLENQKSDSQEFTPFKCQMLIYFYNTKFK